LPLGQSHPVVGRVMINSLMAEFPYVSLWIPCRYEGVAIASMEPLTIDVDRLRQRMAEPAIQEDLASYGLGNLDHLLATFVAADAELAAYCGDVPLVTDNQPRIEYFTFYPRGAVRFDEILSHRGRVEDYLSHPLSEPAALERSREVMNRLWHAYELEKNRRFKEARGLVGQALQTEPQNAYLQYRLGVLKEKSQGK
jgi:spermidine synthase